MIRWLIEHSGGLIKNEKQAEYVLLAFVVVALVVSMFMWSSDSSDLQEEARAMIEKSIRESNTPR